MTHPDLHGLFHTGMVVDDLDVAMHDMGVAFGLQWAEPIRSRGDIRIPGGTLANRESRVTYSVGGPHHIELIEQVDDTAWRKATGGPLVHHIGFAVQDLQAEVTRLESLGYALEFSGVGEGDSLATMSYLRYAHGGLWIELVEDSVVEELNHWMNEGQPPSWTNNPTS
jgi:hypothetical protein